MPDINDMLSGPEMQDAAVPVNVPDTDTAEPLRDDAQSKVTDTPDADEPAENVTSAAPAEPEEVEIPFEAEMPFRGSHLPERETVQMQQDDTSTEPEADTLLPEPEDYGDDPFAASAAAADELPERNRGGILLRVLAVFVTMLVTAFSLFCVFWDVRKGTTAGGSYRAGDIVNVQIVQQPKPESDPALTDDTGRYTYEGIAKTVMPSITEIYTYQNGVVSGSGSGIILTEDGYIATNSHVVAEADSYSVSLFDDEQTDKTYDAVLIGHDTKTDIAVLKISASGLKPAALGDSDEVQLGERVCALGNPAGLSGSITTGIISGMNRKVRARSTNFEMDCFQTDAAISPGNSGGALVNLYGQVIGITSSKYSSSIFTSGGSYEGIGFAITINEALPIIKELMEQGYVSGRVRIGIQFLDNDDAKKQAEEDGTPLPSELDGKGILVLRIDEDSDLRRTDFRPGDWILQMNGKTVSDYDSINAAISGATADSVIHCRCARVDEDGKVTTFEIDFRLLEDQSGDY